MLWPDDKLHLSKGERTPALPALISGKQTQGLSRKLLIIPRKVPLDACSVDRGLLEAWHRDANSVTHRLHLNPTPFHGAATHPRSLHQCLICRSAASMAGREHHTRETPCARQHLAEFNADAARQLVAIQRTASDGGHLT